MQVVLIIKRKAMFTKKLTWVSLALINMLVACKKNSDNAASGFVVTTFAGSTLGFADGTGTAAKFGTPTGIAIDASRNLYVADADNYRIRKITPSGIVTTFAGNGTRGQLDGNGNTAQFSSLHDIAIDGQGNLYVTDINQIRKITPAGVVSTLTNGIVGYVDGNLSTAQFNSLQGITVDGSGNIYVVDCYGLIYWGARIRKIAPDGTVSTLAGNESSGYADGNGNAAKFSRPNGITVDPQGNLYVADYDNFRVRKITPWGEVSSMSLGASRYGPTALCSDGQGNIYTAALAQVYKISFSGTSVEFIAGSTPGFADGNGNVAMFSSLQGIVLDAQGNIFVADYLGYDIRKISKK